MLFLAPMHGYTDYVFRNTYAKYFHGIDMAVSPFIALVEGRRVKTSVLRDLLAENNGGMPVIPQVIGNNASQFILMANTLYDMGFQSANWNLGCPMKNVARKKRGAGLLQYPDIIESTLAKLIPKTKLKVSVKIRLGYKSISEIEKLIPVLNSFPLEYVVLHPRLGIQMYDGHVDLEAFGKYSGEFNHPLIYNGDIDSIEFFRKVQKRFPEIDKWMLGRGLLANFFLPYLISEEDSLSITDQKNVLKDFHLEYFQNLQSRWDKDEMILNKMKEHWSNFRNMYVRGQEIHEKMVRINDLTAMKDFVQNVTESEEIKNAF